MSTWGRKRSARVLAEHRRQHPPERCEQCGVTGVKLYQDHVVNLANGGPDTVENLAWLCGPCHDVKSERERRKGWEAKQQYRNRRRRLPVRPHPGD